jgi:hypothetical protein
MTSTDDRLDRYRRLYEADVRTALADAIALCAREGVPLPSWAAVAFLRVQNDVLTGRRDVSWDDELGLSLTKGRRVREARYRIATRAAEVGNAILDAHAQGRAIDRELKAEVAQRLGLSERQIDDCWRAYRRHAERLALDDDERITGTVPPT